MSDKLTVSTSPHVQSDESIRRIMFAVIYSLVPATLAAVYFFGPRALALIGSCVGAALLTEYLFLRVRRQPIVIWDGSVIITGVLLALTLPPTLPIYMAIIGSVVAVALGKQIFGGLGHNIFNPALVGRAFLQATFPVYMAKWATPAGWLNPQIDAANAATPLGLMKFESVSTGAADLFLGSISGSMGETSVLALLLGAAYLYYKGYIEWRIPATILGTVAAFSAVLWVLDSSRFPDPFFMLFSGSLVMGAFYMATDYVTSPITPRGKLIFGIGIGIVIVIIRIWGGLPEGVMYSILLFNALTPLINRYTKTKIYGGHSAPA